MGLLERLVVTTVDRNSLRAAVAAAGVDPEPWSLAAWYVASDDHQPSPGVGRNDGDGSGALDADIVRLLCRATFVLEIGVVAAGLYVEHHYLHDGHLAMPVVSGADLSVGEPQPLRPLLEALAAEAVGGADGSLEADTVAREGALLIRTVHLGPEGCLAWPVIELVGPPGRRGLARRDADGHRVEQVDQAALLVLLRLAACDGSLADDVDDQTYELTPDEFVALAALVGRTGLVALAVEDVGAFELMAAKGAALLEERSDLDVLVDLLDEPDEELELIWTSPAGASVVHLDVSGRTATIVRSAADKVLVIETSPEGARRAARDELEAVPDGGTLLVVRHRDGVRWEGTLRREGGAWLDPDGGDPSDVLGLLLT